MPDLGHIALLVPSLEGGGAERVMLLLANGLAARGLEVELVVATRIGAYADLVAPEVRVINLSAARVIRSLPGLVRYLRHRRPSVLISALSHTNIIATIAVRLAARGTPLIVTEHVHASAEAAATRSWRLTVQHALMRAAYPYASRVVAVSDGVADDLSRLLRLPRQSIHAIHNPIVSDALCEMKTVAAPHPWLADRSIPIILGAGRLSAQKDFRTLVDAFALLRSERAARLVIIGEGEQRAEVEAAVAGHQLGTEVLLPGFVSNPFAWLAHARVFVLSSRFEGFGNVLVEAMACGTPVVSTDCQSGPAEILADGKWGRLVPVGDSASMARAIAACLDEPRSPDLARRAADFSVDAAVDRYLDLLKHLA